MINIIFYPDYSSGNPYQKLLYSKADKSKFNIIPGDINIALKYLKLGEKTVFHIHWINKIINNLYTEKDAWLAVHNYIEKLEIFIEKGGRLVWTIHNSISHESVFIDAELRLRHYLSSFSHVIHLHCASHLEYIKDFYNFDPHKLIIFRHGNYIDYYGKFDLNSRINNNEIKMLFIGSLRGYKSIDTIINIMNLFSLRGFKTMLAGCPDSNDTYKYIENKLNPSCNRLLRRISEKEIHILCTSYNVGLLSYNKILTSGTLKLYCSYGMNIFAKRLPTILFEDRYNTFYYFNENDMEMSINNFLKQSNDDLTKSLINNYYLAKESVWSDDLLRFIMSKCDYA